MRENGAVRVAAFLFLFAGVLSAQVQNAASATAGIYGPAAVAPGSLAFINDGLNPPTISGAVVSIRPVGSSTPIPAQIISASSSGLTFLVPPDTPLGNAQLIYHKPGELTQWTTVAIVANDFALYSTPATGMNMSALGVTSPNELTNPAQPGQVVQIFGTGVGVIPANFPQIMLGGVAQQVLYAGIAPGQPGMNQINFQIAPGTPDGCYLPLLVTWGGVTATSYLSKTSDGMPCHHPFGLSTSALQTLDAGGYVEVGSISMNTALNVPSAQRASRQESASVSFSDVTASEMATSYFGASPAQGCGTAPFAISGMFGHEFFEIPASPFGGIMTLQNGATDLTLTNNGGIDYTTTITPSGDAPLNHLPAPIIGGGQWTWSSTAGVGVPASSFNFNLAAPVQINGGAPISIQTGQDQTITWNGSGFDSGANLELSLAGYGAAQVTCFAPANTGTMTIPAGMLGQFSSGGVGTLTVSVTNWGAGMPYADFNFANGNSVLMLVSWTSSDTRPVDFK